MQVALCSQVFGVRSPEDLSPRSSKQLGSLLGMGKVVVFRGILRESLFFFEYPCHGRISWPLVALGCCRVSLVENGEEIGKEMETETKHGLASTAWDCNGKSTLMKRGNDTESWIV